MSRFARNEKKMRVEGGGESSSSPPARTQAVFMEEGTWALMMDSGAPAAHVPAAVRTFRRIVRRVATPTTSAGSVRVCFPRKAAFGQKFPVILRAHACVRECTVAAES